MTDVMSANAMRRRLRPRGVVVLVLLAWVGLMGTLGGLLASSQASARRGVAELLMSRTSSGAVFASLYVRDIFARERQAASQQLAGRRITQPGLALVARDLGFPAAVLLDQHGRVLQAVPSKPGLLGVVITGRYPHLAAAVAGGAAASNVVASAARGIPVVAFAVPFATPSGRRVFSGAFSVANTPLGQYMNHVIVLRGRRVYLVDATGTLIASSGPALKAGEKLSGLDTRLATIAERHALGSYDSPRGRQSVVSAVVPGTSWRIVVAAPDAVLYASVDGASRWLAWFAMASLTLAGLVIIMLGARLLRDRARLGLLNGELDVVARVDALTGLRNRRDIEETLVAALSAARRRQASLAVLLIDIDHFKSVNDTLGHHAGDAVLVNAAQTMRSAMRIEDAIGRWGGEEFLAVLPDTNADGAVVVAERVQAQLATQDHGNPDRTVTVTIGVAVWPSGGMDDLLTRADTALYAGKAAGRNTIKVFAAGASPDLTFASTRTTHEK